MCIHLKLYLLFPESTVEQNVSVVLNGVESELKFIIGQKGTKVNALNQFERIQMCYFKMMLIARQRRC